MVNVTWYFNGVKLRQVDDPFINFSNRRKELVVGPLNISHAGRYQCQAANEVNRDEPLMSNTMFIHVHGKLREREGSWYSCGWNSGAQCYGVVYGNPGERMPGLVYIQ